MGTRKKNKEFYWIDRDNGTFYLDGTVHNISEYDLNDIFRGEDINDGILERHFRVMQLMKQIDENCYYTKEMELGKPFKKSNIIMYQFYCNNAFMMENEKECKALAELLKLVDAFMIVAPLKEEKATELGNHVLCITFSIHNVWKKSNLDYIRGERKESNDEKRYD